MKYLKKNQPAFSMMTIENPDPERGYDACYPVNCLPPQFPALMIKLLNVSKKEEDTDFKFSIEELTNALKSNKRWKSNTNIELDFSQVPEKEINEILEFLAKHNRSNTRIAWKKHTGPSTILFWVEFEQS
jgi:hypothetical protein